MNEDFTRLDDPDLLAEAERVRAAVAALTERFRTLSDEFTRRAAGAVTAGIAGLPVPVARMQAVEILLADPEALEDDVLESCLYLLRERLSAA
jgi:hypothetical protein